LSIAEPLSSTTLTIPVGVDYDDSAMRDAELEFDVAMKALKLRSDEISRRCAADISGLPEAPAGFGLDRWLLSVAEAIGRKDSAELAKVVYKVEFTVDRGVRGGVVVKGARVVEGGIGVEALRKQNYNRLTITFTENTPTVAAKAAPRGGGGVSPEAKRELRQQLDRERPLNLRLDRGGRLLELR
jgi:hypothetical protein